MDSENEFHLELGIGDGKYFQSIHLWCLKLFFFRSVGHLAKFYERTAPRLRWKWIHFVNILFGILILIDVIDAVVEQVMRGSIPLQILNTIQIFIYFAFIYLYNWTHKNRDQTILVKKLVNLNVYISILYLRIGPMASGLVIYNTIMILGMAFVIPTILENPIGGIISLIGRLYLVIVIIPACLFIHMDRPKSAWKQKVKAPSFSLANVGV